MKGESRMKNTPSDFEIVEVENPSVTADEKEAAENELYYIFEKFFVGD
ncbi:MAG: hypothetical protein NC078_09440 [Ruminococcus sp.]|nr:hypothetical protein [Ruminococcus sp.]